MDTAQRGMGLEWPQTQELIARSGARAAERGAVIACGAGTDQLPGDVTHPLPTIRAAYRDQLAVVQAAGARPILMASRALAASGAGAGDYIELYGELIEQADRPVILHWLGEQFDPALHGYWGSADLDQATDVVAEIAASAAGRVDGVKVSVLDPARELALRDRLPAGVRLYTGDDFNFASLIRGDADGHSDALLGAFAAVAAPAAHALHALDAGDLETYDAVMGPAETLGRKVFEAPTSAYKVGVAFLAWLNGFQPYFAMIDGFERRRDTEPPGRGLRARRRGRRPAPARARRRAHGPAAGRSRGPAVIGPDRLSLNQATIKHATLPEAVDVCAALGIPGIGLWRDRLQETGARESAQLVRAAGLQVTSLCRGGFFTHTDPAARAAAIADNLAALDEAAAVGAPTLVLVSGGLPPGSRDLVRARQLVADALGELAPRAGELGVRLGIEALHPMFCADRCVVSTLGQALDLAEQFPADQVGVVVDSYHVWWDPDLFAQIARAGAGGRIVSFQLCDWVVPLPADVLMGRGHLGDGSIDFAPMTAAVLATGYDGLVEVEIFNEDVWAAPPRPPPPPASATPSPAALS